MKKTKTSEAQDHHQREISSTRVVDLGEVRRSHPGITICSPAGMRSRSDVSRVQINRLDISVAYRLAYLELNPQKKSTISRNENEKERVRIIVILRQKLAVARCSAPAIGRQRKDQRMMLFYIALTLPLIAFAIAADAMLRTWFIGLWCLCAGAVLVSLVWGIEIILNLLW
jgi:hypothetical protein